MGQQYNGLRVKLVHGTTAGVAYDADQKLLTLTIVSGITTAGDLATLINTHSLTPFDAAAEGVGEVTARLVQGVTSGGLDGNAVATVRPGGAHNDFVVKSRSLDGTAFDGVVVKLVDTGAVTNGGATVSYNDDPLNKLLLIDIQNGVTRASDIIGALNATRRFTASNAADNNGTGAVHMTPISSEHGAVAVNLPGVSNDFVIQTGIIYFYVEIAGVQELWSSNGDTAQKVSSEILPGAAEQLVEFNGSAYFIGTVGADWLGLWRANGAQSELIQILPESLSNLTATTNGLYYVVDRTVYDPSAPLDTRTVFELWRLTDTDGDVRTSRVRTFTRDAVQPKELTGVGADLFFVRNNDQLWRTRVDQGIVVTEFVMDFDTVEDATIIHVDQLLGARNTLFVVLSDKSVWISDGSDTGTLPLTDAAGAVLKTLDPGTSNVLGQAKDDVYLVIDDPAADRLHHLTGSTAAVPFQIETSVSFAGFSHPDSDRDEIRGGDGDDIIIGNRDHDRLFGESGRDFFVGEFKEIRDLDVNESAILPPTSQFSGNQPEPVDKIINFVDSALEAGIAEALGIPVTNSYQGTRIAHEPVYASQINTLRELQLGSSGITDLAGIKFATNLEVLNLSDNRIDSLSALRPALDKDSGQETGFRQLRFLALEFNDSGTLAFDGNNDVVVLDPAIADGLRTLTIEFWMNTTVASGQAILSGAGASSDNELLVWLASPTNLQLYVRGAALSWTGLPSLADGRWRHVALTLDVQSGGGFETGKLYLDGADQGDQQTAENLSELDVQEPGPRSETGRRLGHVLRQPGLPGTTRRIAHLERYPHGRRDSGQRQSKPCRRRGEPGRILPVPYPIRHRRGGSLGLPSLGGNSARGRLCQRDVCRRRPGPRSPPADPRHDQQSAGCAVDQPRPHGVQ